MKSNRLVFVLVTVIAVLASLMSWGCSSMGDGGGNGSGSSSSNSSSGGGGY